MPFVRECACSLPNTVDGLSEMLCTGCLFNSCLPCNLDSPCGTSTKESLITVTWELGTWDEEAGRVAFKRKDVTTDTSANEGVFSSVSLFFSSSDTKMFSDSLGCKTPGKGSTYSETPDAPELVTQSDIFRTLEDISGNITGNSWSTISNSALFSSELSAVDGSPASSAGTFSCS